MFIENILSKKTQILAYPYGSYNADTVNAAIDRGFKFAFTTDEESVSNKTGPYRIGRFQVKNQDTNNFAESMERWIIM